MAIKSGHGSSFAGLLKTPAFLSSLNVIVGDNSANTLDATEGDDSIYGKRGNDTINMGPYLTVGDTIDGGAGNDTVNLSGDYSEGFTFAPATMVNVEKLSLAHGYSYNLTTDDATVRAGKMLTIDASTLSVDNSLIFNGAAEHDGSFTIIGGYGNDNLTGGANGDTFNLARGGDDTVQGGAGDDGFHFGNALTSTDHVDGGSGYDTVYIGGNAYYPSAYREGLAFSPTTILNVEDIVLAAGHNYFLATDDANVAAGQTLTIDGSALGPLDVLAFEGDAEKDGNFIVKGGAGNDTVWAGAGADSIATAGGDDWIVMASHLTAADRIDGGDGIDTVTLSGDYSTTPLVFTATTMTNIERLYLYSSTFTGDTYNITTNDATVAAGQRLEVHYDNALSGASLTFNGSAEKDGSFSIWSTGGNDTIRLGAGTDQVYAGLGDDNIFFGANLTADDRVDGGGGNDVVRLSGDYATTPLVFTATTMINVERIVLSGGHDYTLTTNDNTVMEGKTLTIDNSGANAGVLTFDGSAETDGKFRIISGDAADVLTGGASVDTFVYNTASQSTSTTYDTLNAVNFAYDRFDTPGAAGTIAGIDTALTSGNLSMASFDADMSAAVAALGAHHAMLFTPNGGTLSGQTFMVVDLNGTAGYQAGQDLVIRLSGQTGTLTTGAFT